MPKPDVPTKFYEKDNVDKTLDRVLSATGEKPPTRTQLNEIFVAASIQDGIRKYRAEASGMTDFQLEDEQHISKRLSEYLSVGAYGKPQRCHAHAIIGGKHRYAIELRAIMAWLKIRIDDPDNGCWLPENTAATPHPLFPQAPPHSRIHRFNYYFWLTASLARLRTENDFRKRLQEITRHLHQATFPPYVMLKKGQGLPRGESK